MEILWVSLDLGKYDPVNFAPQLFTVFTSSFKQSMIRVKKFDEMNQSFTFMYSNFVKLT